jgi:polysaccharide deacetylase 2 family uncharacterized protein YibQ
MAARKKGSKKKPAPRRRPKQQKGRSFQAVRVVVGLAVLVVLVLGVAYWAHREFGGPRPPAPVAVEKPGKIRPAEVEKPTYEIYPHETVAPPKPPTLPAVPRTRPEVAIIVDDLGYDKGMAQKFIGLDAPALTVSILPDSPFLKTIAGFANQKGYDVMLHLPMEPDEYPTVKPGPGALLMSMTPDELIAQLNHDLDQIPYLKGVNNHMGSRMTKDPPKLRQIFTVLKKRELFFIDSRTTAETLCEPSARLLQVPFAERDVFIDHSTDPAFIRRQIKRLIQRAKKQGYAIGIAHPHQITYSILEEVLPELQKEVDLVPVSRVVKILG